MRVDKQQLYKDYLLAKVGEKTIKSVYEKYGVTKSGMYFLISEFEKGDKKKIAMCHKMCLWEHKYKRLFVSLPKSNTHATKEVFASFVREMHNDGFHHGLIAKLTGKHRTTVLHHIKK